MSKMLVIAVFALGTSFSALANDAHETTHTETTETETPATTTTTTTTGKKMAMETACKGLKGKALANCTKKEEAKKAH